MSTLIDSISSGLTVGDILDVIASSESPPSFRVTSRLKNNKRLLIEALLRDNPQWGDILTQAAEQSRLSRRNAKRTQAAERQRKRRSTSRGGGNFAMNTEEHEEQSLSNGDSSEPAPGTSPETTFFDLPPESILFERYHAFYEATSNQALRKLVCAVSRVYPRVFVIKLFPKKGSAGIPLEQLQNGMRGNVTSFEVNSDMIADMISGSLMPQPPEILASVLSVTFIGRSALPDPAKLHIFRVRRHLLVTALNWLHDNNPKYYGDIVVDDSRLERLPEDGVPEEIITNMRHEPDESVLNVELDTYVPSNEEGSDLEDDVDASASGAPKENTGPDVIPLQFLGVMDTDLSKVSARELMAWGLSNLWSQNQEGGYAVRYGQPVSTFGRPPVGQEVQAIPTNQNFWEKALPGLYPYGVGGIEGDQPVPLSFIEHVRWSLQYHDRRFRLHPTFIFIACNIQQRREALASARIQMRRHDFVAVAHILNSITPKDLEQAAEEESRSEAPSNPAIRTLKRHINVTASRVLGSDASRIKLRSRIWSTTACLNPPSLWLTINPDDLHDPIAQVFAGEEIDMDAFDRTAGPNKDQRAQNIARDPFAAAEFFRYTVTAVLEILLGVRATSSRVHSQPGIFGHVSGYFGTVECQGRGTLHLHMLIWLKDTPPPEKIKSLLQSSVFRDKVLEFIRHNVRSFISDLSNSNQVASVHPNPEIAYSRIPKPSSTEPEVFSRSLRQLETEVVRTKQLHTCTFKWCLRLSGNGQMVCKRGAPWPLSDMDVVNEDGTYLTKRTYGYLNSYCPILSILLRCNNDLKLLLHGDTNDLLFYVTNYVAKKQGKSYNASAMLAKGLLYHYMENDYNRKLLDRQRLLLFRAINVLNREQEMSAPLAVCYLMGWNDTFCSHHYTPIYWGAFLALILETFPELKQGRTLLKSSSKLNNEQIVLDFDAHGRLVTRSQVEDYIHRGTSVEGYNLLQYLVDTYEQGIKSGRAVDQLSSETSDHTQDSSHDHQSRPGRPRHTRISYLASHPRHASHHRILRAPNHNTLPNFVGPKLPHKADSDQCTLHAVSMLTLLKPWRSLLDLKSESQTWEDALEHFLATSGDHRHRDFVSSIDHYHSCRNAVGKDPTHPTVPPTVSEELEELELDDEGAVEGSHILTAAQVTPEMISKVKEEAFTKRELQYGRTAVDIGYLRGFFNSEAPAQLRSTVTRGTHEVEQQLKAWLSALKSSRYPNVNSSSSSATQLGNPSDSGTVSLLAYPTGSGLSESTSSGDVILCSDSLQEQVLDPVSVDELFPEQRRAFDIVKWHLSQTVATLNSEPSHRPPQLLMLLVGEGGTGKSKVIQTITAEFERQGAIGMLVKSAYTGIAASLIGGNTTHHLAAISVNGKELSDEAKQKLANAWKDIRYLILDECSMLSKPFFSQLARNIGIAKSAYDSRASDLPFGGVNVILCGDFHQFPPVAGSSRNALYVPNTTGNPVETSLGREIYEMFSIVVILKKQVRVVDEVWRGFLGRLRAGRVQLEDINMLRTLVLTNPECEPTDFQSDTWKNACLITPRHIVRMQWNNAAVLRHCKISGEQLFICPAYDTIRKRPLSLLEQYVAAQTQVLHRSHKGFGKNGLPDEVPLALGMSVMVTLNVETELDIANGARGTIVGITLHPDEPAFDPNLPVVQLKLLPLFVLVKMARTRAVALRGLEPGVVPIEPASKSFQITMNIPQSNGNITRVRKTVRRLQYPITPAYAFTDYRSQGQTLQSVIVDIAKPPSGSGLTLFNIYVALSRSSGRNTIRLLRDFDEDVMLQPLDEDLEREDSRLEKLDRETNAWWSEMIRRMGDLRS
ncbi:ATP-dependent DNA helicase PIF1, putative [Rhizoctonia solani AG-3 Rhs1AP]|uniref:ATP-dependent DNA helicase n=2 Tax=Rhizoctonia solani AG-3 TaxID=1086053 RepID=A0A074S8L7_9AGAM|nr:ATP-dependent DNA helicase PIF1, putative [Rhizoctonia solani AG-3 Rhs1AP]KEP46382.1 putative ATP-dependent DNA helicase PIF1 [Rhizoctonia solani 123E]